MFRSLIKRTKRYFRKNKVAKHTVFLGQEYFLPKRKTDDPVLRVKEILFIQCSYILLPFFILLAAFEYYLGLKLNMFISLSAAFTVFALLFYFKSSGKLYLIGFFQIIVVWLKVFVLLLETGGWHSHMILWAILPVFLASIYLDDVFGMFMWLLLTLLSVGVIIYLTANNMLVDTQIAVENYQWAYNSLFGFIFVTIMFLYNNERKIYQQNLTKQISMLEIQREELHSTIEELRLQNEKIRTLNERLEDKQRIIENQLIVLKSFSKARAQAVDVIKKQKAELERVLRDLEDSLKFAEILQNLFLPTTEDFRVFFRNSFIIFQQKQFVGGDFYYFFEPEKNKFLVVVGDCTGHGPSGGIMSALTLIFIKELVDERIYEPLQLLQRLRKKVKSIFVNVKHSHLLYGLEISIVLIDNNVKSMFYSAAHLPIVMIRDGKLLEISTNNNMIGDLFPEDELRQLKIDLQDGDRFYMFSDGYFSQLNEKFEKFSKHRFKTILWNSSFEELSMQKVILMQALNDWRGQADQTDDITVLGFEINYGDEKN